GSATWPSAPTTRRGSSGGASARTTASSRSASTRASTRSTWRRFPPGRCGASPAGRNSTAISPVSSAIGFGAITTSCAETWTPRSQRSSRSSPAVASAGGHRSTCPSASIPVRSRAMYARAASISSPSMSSCTNRGGRTASASTTSASPTRTASMSRSDPTPGFRSTRRMTGRRWAAASGWASARSWPTPASTPSSSRATGAGASSGVRWPTPPTSTFASSSSTTASTGSSTRGSRSSSPRREAPLPFLAAVDRLRRCGEGARLGRLPREVGSQQSQGDHGRLLRDQWSVHRDRRAGRCRPGDRTQPAAEQPDDQDVPLMAKVYHDDDADMAALAGQRVAVIGYGSQGHAHALNLQDSGVDVVVGLYKGSKSWEAAEQEDLRVETVEKAGELGNLLMMAGADEQ